MSLHEYLNTLTPAEAASVFKRCCGAERWVDKMVAALPFNSDASIFSAADSIWSEMLRPDILEAFSHHPKIGASMQALREKFQNTASWSASEQSSVASAKDDTLLSLAQANTDYETRFGYIFIVCATGKSAQEMLDILLSRLPNSAAKELSVAAAEQAKITRIRLEKIK